MRLLAISYVFAITFLIPRFEKRIEATIPKRVLIFSLTKGFHHASIYEGNLFFIELGNKHHFIADTTTDASLFTDSSLQKYSAVVWLNTTGDVLNEAQQNAFKRYIQKGGGYMGIHAATDTEFDWPWYNELAGGYFSRHPHIQSGKMIALDKTFPATAFLPDSFYHKDEFYDFTALKTENLHFLIQIDEKSYEGGKMGNFHPMAWYHIFDGGKAFYSAFGHTTESYNDPLITEHFWQGLKWTMTK